MIGLGRLSIKPIRVTRHIRNINKIMSRKRQNLNMTSKSASKVIKLPRTSDPMLYDDKITIINIPLNEDDGEIVYNDVMNVEEFLEEHNIRMDYEEESESLVRSEVKPQSRPSIIVGPNKRETQSSEISNLYQESKRARLEREKEEKRRRLEEETEFSAEDLSLATVPGLEFDPKRRSFDMEELRPQPIIKKRRKLYASDSQKDDLYWERREKNNVAARRSREARRLKENQIALRVAHLERENDGLRQKVESAQFEMTKLTNVRDVLRRKLRQFE